MRLQTAILVMFRGNKSLVDKQNKRFLMPSIPSRSPEPIHCRSGARLQEGDDAMTFVNAYLRFASSHGFRSEAEAFLKENGYETVIARRSSSASEGPFKLTIDRVVAMSVVIIVLAYVIATSNLWERTVMPSWPSSWR